MDSCLHNILYLHNGCMPFDFDLDDHEMLLQLDKQSHMEHDYSADTS